MAGKLIITTGISSCGRKEIFFSSSPSSFLSLCAQKNVKVKMYNIGEMIPEWAWKNAHEKLPPRNILYVNKLAMSFAQAGVFQFIYFHLSRDLEENDIVLINLHTRFPWWKGNVYLPVYNETFIRDLVRNGFEPNMLVCFIDNANDILGRLKEKGQWKGENLSEKDVYLWQNEEVNITKGYRLLSDNEIRFFVMPVRQPVETLYYLIAEPWKPILYIQMPLSHIKVSDLKRVIWLIGELRKFAVVFDPMTIETGVVEWEEIEKAEGDTEIMVRHAQTGYRDTEWFVPQVDVCLAYYVKLVLTLGMVDETATAAGLGKQTWAIFPSNASPFLPFRVQRIFKNPEECLAAFKTYAEELEKIYKEQKGEAQGAT